MSDQPLLGGIDLGGTKIQAIVVDRNHAVVGQARRPTPIVGGPDDVVAALLAVMEEATHAAGTVPSALAGIGVGSPGQVDTSTGTVANAGNLPGFDKAFPMGPSLSTVAGGVRVVLGNDVQVATDAEFFLGAAKELSSILGVFWGTGVGGGIVLDGKPWVGRGAGGEIGHVVVERNGARCPCGRRGCMEAYAGRRAMEERARKRVDKGASTDLFKIMEKRGRERLTSGVWAKALEQGDKLAIELIDDAVDALGTGVASTCNILDVEAVIIGGGLGIRLGQPFADRIAEAMLPHIFADDRPPIVRTASLGDLGGAQGAALLVAARPAS
jgi:glucokinase